MDYKTTILQQEIKCEETPFPEIEGLFFASLKDVDVFDYTAYFEHYKLTPIDYKLFMRLNKHFIEAIAKGAGRNTAQLFYQNTDGHILVAAELTFLFLAFANPEMLTYFNGILNDALSTGVAYSDAFAYSIAAEKVPTEVLQEIINSRKDEQ